MLAKVTGVACMATGLRTSKTDGVRKVKKSIPAQVTKSSVP